VSCPAVPATHLGEQLEGLIMVNLSPQASEVHVGQAILGTGAALLLCLLEVTPSSSQVWLPILKSKSA
jgi:hypothetical protein